MTRAKTQRTEPDRVAHEVLLRIVRGAYPAGLRLPSELELAAEFACGRSTIREALTELATMGVVSTRRGSGATVRDFRTEGTTAILPAYLVSGNLGIDPMVLGRELLQMRSLLATEAVRLAARYGTKGGFGTARATLARWSTELTPADQALLEIELFRAIVGASGVWPAIWLANSFFAPLRDVHAIFAPAAGGSPADFALVMGKLLDLIEAGSEAAAIKHFERWIKRVDGELIERLNGALSSDGPARASPRPKRSKKTARTREVSS